MCDCVAWKESKRVVTTGGVDVHSTCSRLSTVLANFRYACSNMVTADQLAFSYVFVTTTHRLSRCFAAPKGALVWSAHLSNQDCLALHGLRYMQPFAKYLA